MPDDPDISNISEWRSIITLIVFIFSNLVVLFRFHVAIYIPRQISDAVLDCLANLRVIWPRQSPHSDDEDSEDGSHGKLQSRFVRLSFPMNPTTGPLIGVLFLLAITAIGRKEVKEGTIGANNINPMDIMAFALTIGYVSSAIDASGLIRYLTFKILQRYGGAGHRLFIILYVAFFAMGCLFGNDPVIQMGMLLLTYLTRLSSNIVHPRAWIHTQFAISNVASAIFVSSNTTNVVIAQAFKIGFAEYTASIIVPVMAAVVLLAPFLLYICFADEALIPYSIKMHELPEAEMARKPIPPNIHFEDFESGIFEDSDWPGPVMRLHEVMNPFLDKASAAFGVALMFTTLVVLLALTAANLNDVPVFWATLPAGFVMLCWDIVFGWIHRHETREIARRSRLEVEQIRADRAEQASRDANGNAQYDTTEQSAIRSIASVKDCRHMLSGAINSESEISETTGETETEAGLGSSSELEGNTSTVREIPAAGDGWICEEGSPDGQCEQLDISGETRASIQAPPVSKQNSDVSEPDNQQTAEAKPIPASHSPVQSTIESHVDCDDEVDRPRVTGKSAVVENTNTLDSVRLESDGRDGTNDTTTQPAVTEEGRHATVEANAKEDTSRQDDSDTATTKTVTDDSIDTPNETTPTNVANQQRKTLGTLLSQLWRWLQETFPQVSVVVAHLPFSLILFVFPTFILVQSLVSMGWVTALAHGWGTWVDKTGTVGAIGGMGFLSVVLSNVAGTNIGATVLLSRVIQIWTHLQSSSERPISERTFWGSVYALAIGVNYGAFSLAFAASLAGFGWREDLARKGIRVRALEFTRVNFPLIIITMVVSCSVLVGEVYIMRSSSPLAVRY